MGHTLSDLRPPRGAKRERRRVGRGHGSGLGTTAGKGEKGQKARSGAPKGAGFEGGQMPLQRRLPKRGFKNPFRVEYVAVNVGELARVFEAGAAVETSALRDRGMIPRKATRWKLLGNGEISHGLTVRPQACSESARQKILAAGGSVDIVPAEVRVTRAQAAQQADA